jgi:hypothetical protein
VGGIKGRMDEIRVKQEGNKAKRYSERQGLGRKGGEVGKED